MLRLSWKPLLYWSHQPELIINGSRPDHTTVCHAGDSSGPARIKGSVLMNQNRTSPALPDQCKKQRRRTLCLTILILVCIFIAGVLSVWPVLRDRAAASAGPRLAKESVPAWNEPPADTPAFAQTGEKTGSWNLTLVNPWNLIPADYRVTLSQVEPGHFVDERCALNLRSMLSDCRAAGQSPMICSSYRSQEKQEALYQNKVNHLIAQGYPKETAKAEAGKSVAVPGTSEHQLGLAVDIVDLANQNLDSSQEHTGVQKWLMENSWKYGFILRYPNGKSDLTGIIYEPWHYRYVGKDAAKQIYDLNLCLEEYLSEYAPC